MGDLEVESCEGFEECDLLINEEISSLSAEGLMFLDHDSDVEISGEDSWGLIGFTSENVVVFVWNTWLNTDLNGSILNVDLLSLTFSTDGISFDGFSFSTAIITGDNALLDHESHLDSLDDLTLSLTFSTFFNLASSFSFTSFTVSLSLMFEFQWNTLVDIFKFNLLFNSLALGLLDFRFSTLSSSAAAAAEHRENVTEWITSTAASFLETFFTIFIIGSFFIWVTQNSIGIIQLTEFLGITTSIWMFIFSLDTGFSIGRSNLLFISTFINSKNFIISCVVYLFRSMVFMRHVFI